MTDQTFIEWLQSNKQIVKIDLLAGSISGVALCVSGFPLDTIKVRMQATKDGVFSSITKIAKDGGPLAFFNGIKLPLFTVPIFNAIVFTSYQFCRRLFQRNSSQELLWWQTALCGVFAGSCQSLISCPVELVKCRLQMQSQQYIAYQYGYNGPKDVFLNIIRKEGITNLYRGMFSTWMREIFAFAAYFYFYELAKKQLPRIQGRTTPSSIDLLVAGGIGGVMCWLMSYPQDLIKTVLQTETAVKFEERLYKPRYYDGGFYDCYKRIVAQSGISGLWKGFTPCLARAFIANAVSFYAFEISRDFLIQKYNLQQ